MLGPKRKDRVFDRLKRGVGTTMRPAAAIDKSFWPRLVIAVDPAVGRGAGDINCMLAQRGRCLCFRSVLNQPFGYKVLDKSKGRTNICAAPLLCELSKAEKPWQSAKNSAGRIPVRFHRSHVVLNFRAKPAVTDWVDG